MDKILQDYPISQNNDPFIASEKNLSRIFKWIIGLWFVMAILSLLIYWQIQPKSEGRPISFSTELDLVAEIVNVHSSALAMATEKFNSIDSFSEFNKKLSIYKDKLRALSLATVQDAWSRNPLIELRKKLIGTYYTIQSDLEKIKALNKDSQERQTLFSGLLQRLEKGRNKIIDTTRSLGIRPQELQVPDDARLRIYGITQQRGAI